MVFSYTVGNSNNSEGLVMKTTEHAKELAKWLKDRNLVLQANGYWYCKPTVTLNWYQLC